MIDFNRFCMILLMWAVAFVITGFCGIATHCIDCESNRSTPMFENFFCFALTFVKQTQNKIICNVGKNLSNLFILRG